MKITPSKLRKSIKLMERYIERDPNHWCKDDLVKFKALLVEMEK